MSAAAVAVTVAGVLPVYLLGVLVVQVREDVGFAPSALGALVAGFFGSSALASVLAGRLGLDAGSPRAVRAAALTSTAALLVIGAVADDLPVLTAALLVAGAANGFGQPASNALIAACVPLEHQGVAFGAKQAAIPLSTLLGGLAVPLVALPFGWRAVYVGAAGLGLLAAGSVPRHVSPHRRRTGHDSPAAGPFRLGPLLVLSAGITAASAAGNAVGTFFVASATAVGLAPATAALIAAAAGAGGAATRIGLGLVADRYEGRWLLVVAGLVVVGGGGHALLATQHPPLLAAGVLLAYCSGWAWAGLATYAVARMHPGETARATGVTQGGLAVGAALGPLGFGALAEHASYATAWTVSAALSVLAGALVALGRALLLRDRPALVEAHRVRRRRAAGG